MLLLAVVGLIVTASPSGGQTATGAARNEGRQISLADQLNKGLKAKTKCDKAFIALVVAAVDEGELPRRLVDTTFLWARKHAAKKSEQRRLRPIIYFQPVLVLKAKKIGLKLPAIYQFPSLAGSCR